MKEEPKFYQWVYIGKKNAVYVHTALIGSK